MTAARLRRPTQLGSTALAAVFIALSAPAGAADFQVDNVKLDLGRLVITIPKVAVKGSNLEKDAFLALFAKGANEPAAARIGKGRHTHASLVLHHQLDKLVPGAFRLIANLVQPA